MKEKHLEFVQAIINRMSSNSFLIKGWAITLISALFALSAKDSDQKFIFIAYFPTLMFWLLDSYYLYQERLYRKVYEKVRNNELKDFDLSTKDSNNEFADWICAAFSITIILFYGFLIATILFVTHNL